jgi:hypothetical protein
LRPESVLAVGRQDVQIDFGMRVVPAENDAQPAACLLGMVFVELQAAARAAGGDDFDAVAARPECPGFDEAPLLVGIQRHVDAVDDQPAGLAILAGLPELPFDQRAILLAAAIDRRLRVSRDDGRFPILGERAVAPATARAVERDAAVGGRASRASHAKDGEEEA